MITTSNIAGRIGSTSSTSAMVPIHRGSALSAAPISIVRRARRRAS